MTATEDRFHHEALLYAGPAALVAAVEPVVRAAVARSEPVLVMFDAPTTELLGGALGPVADGVRFADVRAVGRNPARLIPAWRDFVEQHAGGGRPMLGISEPVWLGRDATELVECRHHETLLNVAFPDDPAFRLVCAFDASGLSPSVVAMADATHPVVSRWDAAPGDRAGNGHPPGPDPPGGGAEGPAGGTRVADAAGAAGSPGPGGAVEPGDLLAEPLSDPPPDARECTFDVRSLAQVRRFVGKFGMEAGLDVGARRDLMLAADELATNSVRHASGSGTLRIWAEGPRVVCEVADDGHITDPLVGRRRPAPTAVGGRGLWMVNQVCDLVQIRSSPAGTVVRVHKGRA